MMRRKAFTAIFCLGLSWPLTAAADQSLPEAGRSSAAPMIEVLQHAMALGHSLPQVLNAIVSRNADMTEPTIRAALSLAPDAANAIVSSVTEAGIDLPYVVSVAIDAAPERCQPILNAAFEHQGDEVQMTRLALRYGASPDVAVAEALKAAPARQQEILEMASTQGINGELLMASVMRAGIDPSLAMPAPAAGTPSTNDKTTWGL